MPEQTHYEVLGVSTDATADKIKEAYNHKIRQYHPDKNPPEFAGQANEITKQINEAGEVLLDPARRAEYDRDLEQAESASEEQRRAELAAGGGAKTARRAAAGGRGASASRISGGRAAGRRI